MSLGGRRLGARRLLTAVALLGLVAVAGCQSQAAEPRDGDAQPTASTSEEATTVDDPFVYVAMGDSYTAAQGVPRTAWDGGCLQSDRNYPTLIAEQLSGQLSDADDVDVDLVDVSCSGAATLHMRRERDAGGGMLHPPQYDALSAETDLVTVSIGYNDFRIFHTLFGRCVALAKKDPTGSPCQDRLVRASGFDYLDKRVTVVGKRIARVVEGIHERAPEAQVLVLSYPHLLPETGTCPLRIPLATGDYPYVRAVNDRMAEVLRAAADGVEAADFVDVTTASEGHDACSDNPWMGGIAPLTNRGVAFHPFAVEQRAVAKLVLAAVAAG